MCVFVCVCGLDEDVWLLWWLLFLPPQPRNIDKYCTPSRTHTHTPPPYTHNPLHTHGCIYRKYNLIKMFYVRHVYWSIFSTCLAIWLTSDLRLLQYPSCHFLPLLRFVVIVIVYRFICLFVAFRAVKVLSCFATLKTSEQSFALICGTVWVICYVICLANQ